MPKSISAIIAATSEATFGSSNNEKGDEDYTSVGEISIIHHQTFEDRHIEDNDQPDTDSITRPGCTESRTRTLSSSSLERRLADKSLWGYIDPRTEWPECEEVICDEDIDDLLAARRAQNRQLGTCQKMVFQEA